MVRWYQVIHLYGKVPYVVRWYQVPLLRCIEYLIYKVRYDTKYLDLAYSLIRPTPRLDVLLD